MVFWGGSIRKIESFPYLTWGRQESKISYEEILQASRLVRAGDIGLHREEWCFSNVAIPGFMKHAWIHVNNPVTQGNVCDVTNVEIVEAVQQGVLSRSAMYPLRSDFAIILRPKNVIQADIDFAVSKAKRIVGCAYDYRFDFDIENELHMFNSIAKRHDKELGEDREELSQIKNNMQKWDGGFSCTETVSYAWWHKRRELKLARHKRRGKMVIIGDQMINRGFDIVWMSKSITLNMAISSGLHADGVKMIDEYLNKK